MIFFVRLVHLGVCVCIQYYIYMFMRGVYCLYRIIAETCYVIFAEV